MNKNYQKMMKNDKKSKKTRHSPFLFVSASGHAFFLSRKASQFTHEYFMYAKVKMLLQSSRFVCVILALSLQGNPRHSSFVE